MLEVRYCLLCRYILISVYIVLNLFVGSIVNGSMEAAEEERIKKTEVQEWQGLQVSVMHIVTIPACSLNKVSSWTTGN
eukprot:COSAG01_NODE_1639_length_9653_cov_33.252564_5_plen_78_part_00